jgi:hypothetical protein
LLNQKQDQFKQNHLAQMKELRQKKLQFEQKIQEEPSSLSVLLHNNNADGDSSSITPKKPAHRKGNNPRQNRGLKGNGKNHPEGNDEDYDDNRDSLGELNSIAKFFETDAIPPPDAEFDQDGILKAPLTKELPNQSSLLPLSPRTNFFSSIRSEDVPLDSISTLVADDWLGKLTSSEFG